MKTEKLSCWNPADRFMPEKNDFLFVGKTGFYTHKDRIALIVNWRDAAEREAVDAILNMTGKLK